VPHDAVLINGKHITGRKSIVKATIASRNKDTSNFDSYRTSPRVNIKRDYDYAGIKSTIKRHILYNMYQCCDKITRTYLFYLKTEIAARRSIEMER
jgi:hypothetical protein